MRLIWLEPDTPFPDPEQALQEPAGLLAAGADLSIGRLRAAYSQGIFPWFSEDEPPLWWSPNPRMVLQCDALHLSHSLGKRLRQIARAQEAGDYSIVVKVNTAFTSTLRACARPSLNGQAGTWITGEMQLAYEAWHLLGHVHSIETWAHGELVGGLYGVSLGHMFFGESMFSRVPDASKIALCALVAFAKQHDIRWIDCQQNTRHLASLGAHEIAQAVFLNEVAKAVTLTAPAWEFLPLYWKNLISTP